LTDLWRSPSHFYREKLDGNEIFVTDRREEWWGGGRFSEWSGRDIAEEAGRDGRRVGWGGMVGERTGRISWSPRRRLGVEAVYSQPLAASSLSLTSAFPHPGVGNSSVFLSLP